MSDVWAVVVGSAITGVATLLASAVLPWMRESKTTREEREHRRSEEIRLALQEALETAVQGRIVLVEKNIDEIRVHTARESRVLFQLALLAGPDGPNVGNLLSLAFTFIRQDIEGDKVIGELSRALTEWNAGAATSGEAFDTFCGEFDLPNDNYELLMDAVEARVTAAQRAK